MALLSTLKPITTRKERDDVETYLQIEDVANDDSIYPEVRAAVPNVEDPTLPVSTFSVLNFWV